MPMRNADKVKLLYGPYQPPKARIGRKLFCEIRGTVTVVAFHDGPIPWPRANFPGRPIILCGDLVRAVKNESELAVMHHFGVAHSAVRKWRRALGVRRQNEGSHALARAIALSRADDRLERAQANSKKPQALAKMSKSLKGRVQSPATLRAALKAAKGPRSEHWKQKMAAYWKRRGHPPGHPESSFWTPEEHALLGTATDAEVARRTGRTWSAVSSRRLKNGIPACPRSARKILVTPA